MQQDKCDNTALHIAIKEGSPIKIIEKDNEGNSVLNIAIKKWHYSIKILEHFLDAGGPIHIAVTKKCSSWKFSIGLLLNIGGKDLVMQKHNERKQTALHIAIKTVLRSKSLS